MLNKIWKCVFGGKNFKVKTFTWYIPAPPPRDTGYREKNFDKVIEQISHAGYHIISLHTQAHSGPAHSGMWVVVLARPLSKAAEAFEPEDVDL